MHNKAISSLEDNTHTEQARATDWILRLESDTATHQDRMAFAQWLSEDDRHPALYDEALAIRAALQQVSVADLDVDITTRSFAEKLTETLDSLRGRLTLARLTSGTAVTAALILIVFWLPSSEEDQSVPSAAAPPVAVTQQYSTRVAEVRTLNLSDNTVVTLGAASSIAATFSDAERVVQLTAGEAYFEVAPDASRPFAVRADTLSATAIGTAFDVRRSAAGYKVAVAEGVVEVSSPLIVDGKPSTIVQRQTLTAGEQVGVSNSGRILVPEQIAIDAIGAWQSHQLIYQGDTLSTLLSDANRYSNIPIEIAPGSEAIRDLQVRGAFLGTDIGRLLETVSQILPIQTDHSQDGKILITNKE